MLSRDEQRLEHILEYCKDIAQTTERFGNEYVAFHADKAYHDLICFYLLQIGELSGQLSEKLRSMSNEIPWSQIKGMRNIVAHHYGSIRLEIVWNTVKNDIPVVQAFCERMLNDA